MQNDRRHQKLNMGHHPTMLHYILGFALVHKLMQEIFFFFFFASATANRRTFQEEESDSPPVKSVPLKLEPLAEPINLETKYIANRSYPYCIRSWKLFPLF